MSRRSGILLPIASLPSSFGIGDFGPQAFRFADWLHTCGQKVWSLLPLTLPDALGSPFASASTFAGNWMLVSPEELVRSGLLPRRLVKRYRIAGKHIDYDRVNVQKRQLLGVAWKAFTDKADPVSIKRFADFQKNEQRWLDDYCLFMAIKDRHRGTSWWLWPKKLRERDPQALHKWQKAHQSEIDYFAFGQWVFHEQWERLKQYAHTQGIRILGDLPYYVAHDSVDVWANRKLFQLDKHGGTSFHAGAPPDLFFAKGQIWGNPLYNWAAMRRDGFRWWKGRLQRVLSLYDAVRLDHFRGFVAVWKIRRRKQPASGSWQRVPGRELFRALQKTLGRLPLIVEDLGKITPDVHALRTTFGFPGMRVVQSGFRPDLAPIHHPDNYPMKSVAYTGTHDMPTLREWFDVKATPREQRAAIGETHATKKSLPAALVQLALQSKSVLVILPLQDILGGGAATRINTPGTQLGNWEWRLSELPSQTIAKRLRTITKKSRR